MKTKKPTKPQRKIKPVQPGVDLLMTPQDVADALGKCGKTVHQMVSAGEFPKPDLIVGRAKRWRVATYNQWVADQCGGAERN